MWNTKRQNKESKAEMRLREFEYSHSWAHFTGATLEDKEAKLMEDLKDNTLWDVYNSWHEEAWAIMGALKAREEERAGLTFEETNYIGRFAWDAVVESFGYASCNSWDMYSGRTDGAYGDRREVGEAVVEACKATLHGSFSDRYAQAIAWQREKKHEDVIKAYKEKKRLERREEEVSHALALGLRKLLLEDVWADKQRFLKQSCGASLKLSKAKLKAMAKDMQADMRFTKLLKCDAIQRRWEAGWDMLSRGIMVGVPGAWATLLEEKPAGYYGYDAWKLFEKSASFAATKIKKHFGDRLEEVAKWAEAYFELDMNASVVEA